MNIEFKAVAEYDNWFPSYSDLPTEIIFHIYRFLDHADLQAASATCVRWREALHEPEFHRRTLVRFNKICLADNSSTAQDVMRSRRPFKYFRFEEVTFGQVTQLMQHIGETAREIIFDNVDVSDKQFYGIIQQLARLESLKVTRCSPLFMSGAFLDNNDDRMRVESTLANVRHLSLHRNRYLSDAILLRLTALIRNIETLDLSDSHIAYHNSIQRRFYPNDATASPSESVFTFKFILKVLAMHRTTLRELDFSNTTMSGHALLAMCDIEGDGLNLLRLRLNSCRQLNGLGIRAFLQTQPQLTLLDFGNTEVITDDILEHLVNATPLLETLNIANSAGISNAGAALLGSLKHLRSLDISFCENIGSEGLQRGICCRTNETMRELYMSHLEVCEEGLKSVAQQLPNLEVLNISSCGNGATDDAIQAIIQNLRWLRELDLGDCFRITDMALSGIKIYNEAAPNTANMTESFQPEPSARLLMERQSQNATGNLKISLRSKAEEEIVRDANRKKAMVAAYEMSMCNESDMVGTSIANLRGLRSLNLRSCNLITDVSLKYAFKLPELRSLSLSHCQQISCIGLEAVATNCRSLNTLDLSDCYGINDKTIQVLTEKLSRLRVLHINGCSQLTDHSVDAIINNCKCLQTLSIFRCRGMYTDIEDRLSVVDTMRNLNMDNLGSIDNGDYMRLKKRLDY